jgi:hypothetical protein
MFAYNLILKMEILIVGYLYFERTASGLHGRTYPAKSEASL